MVQSPESLLLYRCTMPCSSNFGWCIPVRHTALRGAHSWARASSPSQSWSHHLIWGKGFRQPNFVFLYFFSGSYFLTLVENNS